MDYESVRNVNSLYVDEEGRLWIGTNDNGLSIAINEQIVNVIDQAGGLPSNSVRDIVRSSDGYYYIGTTSSLQVLTMNYGLRQVNTLTEIYYADDMDADRDGHVATVTSSGTLYLLQGGTVLSSRQMTDGKTVFKSCEFDTNGHLLAATTGHEIYEFDISRGWFDDIGVISTGTLESIKDIDRMDSGELLITADNGVGVIRQDGTFEQINTNEFNNSIDKVMEDYQGNLWFTSSRLGLLRLAPSDFRDIYTTVGMENRVVNTTAL
jgi:energy-coupling factor transport system substrate-specific component